MKNNSGLYHPVVRASRMLAGAVLALLALTWGAAAWAVPLSSNQLASVTISTQAPAPILPGSNATYTVTVNRGAGTGVFNAGLLVTNTLPDGTTYLFNNASLHFSASANSVSTTLTITPSFCVVPTNMTFTVEAQNLTQTGEVAFVDGSLEINTTNTDPTVAILGADPVCPNAATVTFTSTTIIPTPVYNWSVSGNATINGSTTNATVDLATSGPGTFDLSLSVSQGLGGCTASTNLTVTVNDSTPPVITTCAPDVFSNAVANCQAPVPVFTNLVEASDSCGAVTITQDPLPGTLVDYGTNVITIIVTDASGNTATCTPHFVVVDIQSPSITCPGNLELNTDPSSCFATVNLGAPATSDNCDNVTVTNDAPASFPVGTTFVTWTATDAHGNTATCQQIVTVTDAEVPAITCPSNLSLGTDAGQCTAAGVSLGSPTASDNCSVASVTNNAPATYAIGETIVTWTVTDVHGNTATCQQTVTVSDNENPTITCPDTITITAEDGSNSVANVDLGSPVVSDNCGVASVTNNAPASYAVGNTIVIWTVTDIHGNTATCQQTVHIITGTPPVAVNDSYGVEVSDFLDVAAPGVLANDTGDPLSAVLVSGPSHGTLTLNADGSFHYVPTPGYNGFDSFVYKATKGLLESGNATVSLTISDITGANDFQLYASKVSFVQLWTTQGHDRFSVAGKLNPRGISANLNGATVTVFLNDVPLTPPIPLNGNGIATVNSGNLKGQIVLSSATGRYLVSLSGLDLREATGIPDVNATDTTVFNVRLSISGASLDIPDVTGQFEAPYVTIAHRVTRSRFVYQHNDTLSGVFNCNKSTASQVGENFRLSFSGVLEAANGAQLHPTDTIQITIGGEVIDLPLGSLAGTTYSPKLGVVPGLAKFSFDNTRHTFKLTTTAIPNTGLPLAGSEAVTSYQLPLQIAIPTVTGTNLFDTVIELMRPLPTSKKWQR